MSSSSSGGTDAGKPRVCPPNPPQGGTACPIVGLSCEYGNNPNPACNDIVSCQANGWSFPTPGPACPSGTCPGSFGAVPVGQACTPQGLDCAYPEGQCNCTSTLPVAGTNPAWYCATPGNACPEPRPRIGESCSQPGLSCDYGACYGGVALDCSGGYWQEAAVACPVSAG